MEALAAVGLAGNVVQFVQFSGQLFSLAKEIKKKGAPSSLLELRKVAEGLTQQTRVIATRLKANAATLQQEEQHLLNVAADCEKAGEEFIAYIDDLIETAKPSSSLRILQSSVKIKWHHNKIEAYMSRLNELQRSLCLATTLSLRTRETDNHQEILKHLKSIQAGNNASQQSETHMIQALSLLQDLVQQQSGPKLDMLQKQMDSCMKNIQKIRSEIKDTRKAEILHWLDFRQRVWRFEEVEEAHRTTFEWIFQKPRSNTPWHDFGDYLSGAEVPLPYFINGKAGSGKSTLMKYIITHPETKAGLHKWAGRHELFSPHFFFWNVGNQLQKSHTGLLRSLLHSVLDKYQDLIPAVFPTLYISGILTSDNEPPSYIELKSAFERLKTRSASFLRICIFIDGVDEFDGDHRDMSTFLRSVASSTIKVVVSSRPINACLNAFRGCPTLSLQDLTRDDMRVFIRDTLSSHPVMAALQDESPEKAATLKSEIQEKAEGVFLWVRLVTKLLLRGLEDGDDFDDLLPRLRALPSDLRGLYDRMMRKMPSEYQVQASQMLQIFEWWRLYGNGEPLQLLLLSFATQKPNPALDLDTDIWDIKMLETQCERAKSRVRSRCCGLLEVREISTTTLFWPPTPVVAYLHRSVAEFVTERDIWGHIVSLTNNTTFNPRTHIACGILSILKTSHPLSDRMEWWKPSRIPQRPEYAERILNLAMDICRQNDNVEDSFIIQYMDAIDKTMTPKLQRSERDLFEKQCFTLHMHWSLKLTPTCLGSDLQWFSYGVPHWAQANIYSFAAYNGFVSYLRAANRISKLTGVDSLILFALSSWIHGKSPFLDRRDTLSFLLRILVESPEQGTRIPVRENTLWESAVLVANDLTNRPTYRYGRLSDAFCTEEMPKLVLLFEPASTGPASFDVFDRGESWRSSVRNIQSQHHDPSSVKPVRDIPHEVDLPFRTSTGYAATFTGNEPRKPKLEEQETGAFEPKFTREKQQKRVGRPQDSDYLFLGITEEHVLTPKQRYDGLFKRQLDYNGSIEFDVSDAQQAVEILYLFLSIADQPRELINKAISTPEPLSLKPLTVLQNALAQGVERKEEWVWQPEYQFLHQLSALSNTR